MASNFEISARRKANTLHLKLTGNFDGSSAFELINAMKDNCKGISNVFIHTNGLKEIYSFGTDVFQKNLCILNELPIRLLFTGKHAAKITLEKNKFC